MRIGKLWSTRTERETIKTKGHKNMSLCYYVQNMSLCYYVKNMSLYMFLCYYVKNMSLCYSVKNMKVLVSLMVLLSVACDTAENSIYQGHACYFIFDTTLHPVPCQLTSDLSNPGHFNIVSTHMKNGLRHITAERNYDKAQTDIILISEKENNTRCVLGAGNAIIIGRSSYTGLFVCYDGQCANCLEEFGGTSYPLTWSINGQQLKCARCNRSYDASNGVVAQGGFGRQLYQYNVSFDGAILRAWN